MKKSDTLLFCFLSVFVIFVSCTKDKTDDFADHVITYKNYIPMHVGDVQLYRMDSTLPTAFGVQLITESYLAKDSVVDEKPDAVGDTTYFISRFITDTLQEQPWTLATAYRITYTQNTCDLIQADGKRFIKLTTPVRDGYTWDGNAYFISKDQDISSDDPNYFYYNWTYAYDSMAMPYETASRSYAKTVTVNEVDDVQPFDPSYYNQARYAEEVYAEGVGLIYQNILYYIYQPTQGYDLSSFGVTLTRIEQ